MSILKIFNQGARRVCLLGVLLVAAASVYAETNENLLIRLRNQMAQTSDAKAQLAIMDQVGQVGTFQALAFAAEWLGNPSKALAKSAAKAVVDIATKHPEYNGTNTRAWVGRALPLVKGETKARAKAYLLIMPKDEPGYVSLFNGKDLTGWKGLVENPIKRAKMTSDELAKAQVKADETMRKDWAVENGLLCYVGHGYDNICTQEMYGDFEMLVDWKLDPNGKEPDAGIYLRGTPQVQIWDLSRVNVGAQVGSAGLYNNQKNPSKPTCVADNKLGEWNTFYIKMVGDRVTVDLNGERVVNSVILENYWDRSQPIFPVEQLELQAHGSKVYYRDIYVKRLK